MLVPISRRTALTASGALALGCGLGRAFAQTALRAQTSAPGTSVYVFAVSMQTIVQRTLGIQINLTGGMALPRSTLDASRDQTDLFISSPAINYYMERKLEMFKDIADAPQLYTSKIRGILNFPLGPFHILAYESSGIRELTDLKGKKAFLGAPGGAGTVVALAMVEGATGFKPGTDYQQLRLDWTSGNQAFQDKQADLLVIPTELPSPVVMQFALLDKIRLLSIPDDAFASEPMKKLMDIPGRSIVEIPAGTYGANQLNTGPVKTLGSWAGLSTRVGLDDEVVYKVTKAIFENIGEIHAAAPYMKTITRETALSQMKTPLHRGALRYYREIGVAIAPDLVPPEAK